MSAPFRIKICGITTVEDALMAVDAGADAIGLNFFSDSPRCISIEDAAHIAAAVSITTVGVFVNHSANEIAEIVERVGLDLVQLHGDEPFEMVKTFNSKVIRALRCREDGLNVVQSFLSECEEQQAKPEAILLDAYDPSQFGGTGKKLDWKELGETRSTITMPIILAGGLQPNNVDSAIAQAMPDAIDTASGVESAPGVKDRQKVFNFVAIARKAFELE